MVIIRAYSVLGMTLVEASLGVQDDPGMPWQWSHLGTYTQPAAEGKPELEAELRGAWEACCRWEEFEADTRRSAMRETGRAYEIKCGSEQ